MRFKQYIREYEDYVGMHQAPTNDGYNSPLYDVTLNGTYPDDIYSGNAVRYYGDGNSLDRESIAVIHRFKGRPNGKVKIYRAVPDDATELKKKRQELSKIMGYYYKFNFFPMDNQIVNDIEKKFKNLDYDETQKAILDDIGKQIDDINAQIKSKPKLTLNKGDWVTINQGYAKDHGRSALNGKFKILTKTVPAKALWTDGNSIHEWGYDQK